MKRQQKVAINSLYLALIGALDDFLTLYNELKSHVLQLCEETIVPVEDCHNIRYYDDAAKQYVQQMNALISDNCISLFQPILDKYSWFLTDYSERIPLDLSHFCYFSFFSEGKAYLFEMNRGVYSRLYWKDGKTALSETEEYEYVFADKVTPFRIEKTIIPFSQFLDDCDVVFRKAILSIKKKTDPVIDTFLCRDQILAHCSKIIDSKIDTIAISECAKPELPTNKVLYLYDLLINTTCHHQKHPVLPKSFITIREDGNLMALPAHYCTVCNKYMMGNLSYSMFSAYFGKLKTITKKCENPLSDLSFPLFNDESELHKMGYTVEKGKLTEGERHSLLISIYENKELSFFEICSTIERNIRLFQNNQLFVIAVMKWQSDLKFINKYVAQKMKKEKQIP